HNPTNLFLDLLDVLLVRGEGHPAELDRLANLLIHLLRTDEGSHALHRVGIYGIEFCLCHMKPPTRLSGDWTDARSSGPPRDGVAHNRLPQQHSIWPFAP